MQRLIFNSVIIRLPFICMRFIFIIFFFSHILSSHLRAQGTGDSLLNNKENCYLLRQNFHSKKIKLIYYNDSLIKFYKLYPNKQAGPYVKPTGAYLGLIRGKDTTYFPKFQFLACNNGATCISLRNPLLYKGDNFYMANKMYPIHIKTFKKTILSLNNKELGRYYIKYKNNKTYSNIAGLSTPVFLVFTSITYVMVNTDEFIFHKLSPTRPLFYIACTASGTSIITYTITVLRKRHFRKKLINRYNDQIS
jgi:hypothetical protein